MSKKFKIAITKKDFNKKKDDIKRYQKHIILLQDRIKDYESYIKNESYILDKLELDLNTSNTA